ncbi:nucleoside-diphosphate kinase [Streptomyces sp. VNUA116]|uniref:nucleoside-diphosphate kinase n=1 Tax=Streptomyces sp. VNUA116 TaxID=3062449 RepID=UPI00267677F9|nr:nucleoside-diphosphate kinase [Streptomyces sp. VNUA116]WKU42630.1 nucleoside-diphosphate kinase [Streptomyces sp. VNUA116]
MPDSTMPPVLRSPTWARLTRFSGKDTVFAADLFAREAWATLARELGDGGAYSFAEATALMWVRPDAFAAGVARKVLAATQAAGFRPLAVRPVRVDRCGARALWAYMCRWATVERLWLLDALVALGPGLLVLWADDTGEPAAARLTALKGSNAAGRRTGASLRDVAGSPNRLLTMVHVADEPADVVRELGILCPWPDRAALVIEAAARLTDGACCLLEDAIAAVETELPTLGTPAPDTATPSPGDLTAGPLERRWAALWAAAHRWPLLTATAGPAAWPEQESRSPWR